MIYISPSQKDCLDIPFKNGIYRPIQRQITLSKDIVTCVSLYHERILYYFDVLLLLLLLLYILTVHKDIQENYSSGYFRKVMHSE